MHFWTYTISKYNILLYIRTALRYDIRYTYNDTSSLINNFTYEKEILSVNVLYGDLNDPTQAGINENFTITLNDLPTSGNFTK